MSKVPRNHFLIYSTANEKSHLVDFYNFNSMIRHHSGVGKIRLVIVVSIVEDSPERDKQFVEMAHTYFRRSQHIVLEKIITKGNIGRDLSSAKVGLDEISQHAGPEDLVMIRNRSSIGPLQTNWYSAYSAVFDSNESIGLVGNTINLRYHEEIDPNRIAPHVQTYIYLSSFEILENLRTDFPGIHEVDRLKIICEGEIVISERIMSLGYGITCLFWPNEIITNKTAINPDLPVSDVKMVAKGLPFIHRHGTKGKLNIRDYMAVQSRYLLSGLSKQREGRIEVKRIDEFYEN